MQERKFEDEVCEGCRFYSEQWCYEDGFNIGPLAPACDKFVADDEEEEF